MEARRSTTDNPGTCIQLHSQKLVISISTLQLILMKDLYCGVHKVQYRIELAEWIIIKQQQLDAEFSSNIILSSFPSERIHYFSKF